MIETMDFDDGVKVNNTKFLELLVKIKQIYIGRTG